LPKSIFYAKSFKDFIPVVFPPIKDVDMATAESV